MSMARREHPDHSLIVGLLLLAVFLQTFLSMRLKSPTFDEPAHIGAGYSYLKTGDFKVNPQHPPLLKEIAALPLVLIGMHWPMTPEQWAAADPATDGFLQWRLGQAIIFANGPERVLFWSRLPFIGLALLLGLLIYLWGRSLFGGPAAVAALFLYTFDPNMTAHSYLVTTDTGLATFALLFLFTLWRYLNRRTAARLLGCGLTLGLALGSKFSAVILLPIAALLMLVAVRQIPEAVPRRAASPIDPYGSDGPGRRSLNCLVALLLMTVVAAIVVQALYFFPRDPFMYLEGLRRVNADHDPNYWPYMAGQLRPSFWSYYVVAYALKEPLPALLALLAGLLFMLRGQGTTAMDRAFVLLPPAALFTAFTVLSNRRFDVVHQLGIRYLIPALPFLYLVGGAGLASLWRGRSLRGRLATAALCAWLVIGAAGIFPDHLSYFNELACLTTRPMAIGADGGTACGPLWLDDSNVDWGQGLKQLDRWLRDNAAGRALRLGYFGSIRPSLYGIDAVPIGVRDLARPPDPGLYALSAHFVARGIGELSRTVGDGPGNWLRHTRPVAVVGHAYYIYDIPGTGADRPATGLDR